MTARLAGKAAIITGGAGGIGAATAELFCREGARVLLVDRDAGLLAAIVQELSTRIRDVPSAAIDGLAADVASVADAERCVRHARATFGALDVLVSNAAVRDVAPIAAADPAAWQRVLEVNLMGALNFCKAAVPALRRRAPASDPSASIVIVSSTYATIGRRNFGAYDASKAALLALMRTLAAEEAEHGVRVNAVCPGGTLTPFTIARARARGRDEASLRATPKPDSLLRRWAEPLEIAYPILWLACDEASFITGVAIPVDGGMVTTQA